jgi:hypothetical protein
MSESNLKVPVNTPAVDINDSMPLNWVHHNFVTQVAGTQIKGRINRDDNLTPSSPDQHQWVLSTTFITAFTTTRFTITTIPPATTIPIPWPNSLILPATTLNKSRSLNPNIGIHP